MSPYTSPIDAMELTTFLIGAASGLAATGLVVFAIRFVQSKRKPGFAELLYNLRSDLLAETMRRRVMLDRKQSKAVLQATKLLSAARGIPPGKSFETYRDDFGKALFAFQHELSASRPFVNQETAMACEEIESILVDMVSLSAEESRKMATELWSSLRAARQRFDDCVQLESEREPYKNDAVRLVAMHERKNGQRMPAKLESQNG